MDAAALADLAIDIAREAGELARRRRQEGVAIAATKSAIADIVTEADREVETLIRARLSEDRPEDGFLGEESGAERGSSGITWVVDPIDGTVNYAYGMPHYAVSIAAVTGDPTPTDWIAEAAAVHNPVTGEVFHAVRGGGAWHGSTRLSVSEPGDAGALVATGFGYDPKYHAGDLARVAAVMPLLRDLRRAGSAALDLAYVAAGRLDGYFERGLQPWDHAAGALLVVEAGGRISGSPGGRPGSEMTIAARADLHDRIAERIAGV
ncbi:inositol monophosphatase [Microbacterium sp. EYE_5]|uniref:inositol monophosphatase family protein n=1 Tax=unclassified Microbacterium TaxID=2609290 RepID=UPI002002BC89|nr:MULTISPECIES: inositol monophosphatase family protein [unclassified Microbacterium]MCK6080198.1 inositol monophosphatase [Microbacterium sp. EYE_382]MCK6085469.1 inositol monophosphatase [Microbacterium sp. EYE_384]MCK6122306.1 inositol monophosphatase [Microbacterium sp. EYE_80]MCK6126232.1 inositol monophosphatase [Microbacterium sp. EYE_79]MCK6141153.1 inositol monophosphatase [Microbacterium sp. EYE_39]